MLMLHAGGLSSLQFLCVFCPVIAASSLCSLLLLCCLLRFFCLCVFTITWPFFPPGQVHPIGDQWLGSVRRRVRSAEMLSNDPMQQKHCESWTWTNFCEAPFSDVRRLKVHEESWFLLSGVSKTSKHSVKSSVEWNPSDAAGMTNLSQ